MKTRRSFLGGALALSALAVAASIYSHNAGAAHAKRARKHLLVVSVTKGFHHGSVPLAAKIIEELGVKSGEWDTDFVKTDEDMAAKMTPAALSKYDAVVFGNTTGVLPLPDPQGFLDYIKAGHGFAAMHSGSDTFHDWPNSNEHPTPYIDMLGGEFQEHHGRARVEAHVEDADFPACREMLKAAKAVSSTTVDEQGHSFVDFPNKIWNVRDEIYLQKNNDRTKVHVLLSMKTWPDDGSPNANQPGDHLLSWDKAYGKGRVFYVEMGHTPDDPTKEGMWTDPIYQAYVKGGLEFVLGLAKGSTEPNKAL